MIKAYTSKGTVMLSNSSRVRESIKTLIAKEVSNYLAIRCDDGIPTMAYIDSNNELVLESVDSLNKAKLFCWHRKLALIADSSHYGI